MSGSGLETLHRVWQENEQNLSAFWSQISRDGGLSWEQPIRISDRNNPAGEPALAVDGAGTPHLVQLTGFTGTSAGAAGVNPVLQHWAWTDNSWIPREPFALQPGSLVGVDGIAAAVAANSNLVVLYSGLNLNVQTGRLEEGFWASARSLELVVAATTPVPAITSTVVLSDSTPAASTTTPVPAPTILPTPTVFFPQNQDGDGGFSIPLIGNLSPVTAIVPIGFIVLVVVFIGMRVMRRER
jgi:hypothetical protein